MAIKTIVKNNENRLLVEFKEAYCVINGINTDNNNANIELAYYVNEAARVRHKEILSGEIEASPAMPMHMDGEPYILKKNIQIPMNKIDTLEYDNADMSLSEMLKKSCYLHLMGLDEFVNAIAV